MNQRSRKPFLEPFRQNFIVMTSLNLRRLRPELSNYEQAGNYSWPTTALEEATLAELLALFGGDKLREVLSMFRTDLVSTMDEINSAIHGQNAERVRFLTHRLKGVCYQIGAINCWTAASNLEAASIQSNFSGPALEALHVEGAKLQIELENIIR